MENRKTVIPTHSCPICGRILKGSWNYCPYCTQVVRLIPCPHCEQPLDKDWSFCPFCKSAVSANLKEQTGDLFSISNAWLTNVLEN